MVLGRCAVRHACARLSSNPYSVCIFLPASACQGRTLTTAWVGDSRMVLGRQRKKGWRSSWEAIDLSDDHKPTTPEERQRILDSHGRVERWGTQCTGCLHGAGSCHAASQHVQGIQNARSWFWREATCRLFVGLYTTVAACIADLLISCSGQGWREVAVLVAASSSYQQGVGKAKWCMGGEFRRVSSYGCAAVCAVLEGWLTRLGSPWGPTVCGWSTHGCQGWR